MQVDDVIHQNLKKNTAKRVTSLRAHIAPIIIVRAVQFFLKNCHRGDKPLTTVA